MKLALSPKSIYISRFPLGILDRYLIWELYKSFFAVAVVLILIIFSNNFVRSLEKIMTGQFSVDVLWILLGFDLLQMIGLLIPPAFFFATLISLGRLYRDSEIIAMQSSGVSPVVLFRAYLLAAIPVVALVSYLVLVTMPWAEFSMIELKASQDRDMNTFASIETGKFLELQKGKTVFFAASGDDESGVYKDVFVQNRRNGDLGIISAKEGYQYIDHQTGQHYLVFKNGYRYIGEPGQNQYTISAFYEYGIRIQQAAQVSASIPAKAMSSAELWGSAVPKHQYEMQFRYSIPLSLFALTLLAVPLSRSMPRQGLYGRMFMAFIVYFSFMNLHKIAEKWMETGQSPLWLGMWWLPVVAVVVAILIELSDRHSYRYKIKKFLLSLNAKVVSR